MRIEKLLDQYYRGESSLEEEQELRQFFAGDEVPLYLKEHQPAFVYFREARKEKPVIAGFEDKIRTSLFSRKSRIRKLYRFTALAATLLILVAISFTWFYSGNRNLSSAEDPEIAYAQAKKALYMVSANLNSGLAEAGGIGQFREGLGKLDPIAEFHTGMESFRKVDMFENSKQMITSKNQ